MASHVPFNGHREVVAAVPTKRQMTGTPTTQRGEAYSNERFSGPSSRGAGAAPGSAMSDSVPRTARTAGPRPVSGLCHLVQATSPVREALRRRQAAMLWWLSIRGG